MCLHYVSESCKFAALLHVPKLSICACVTVKVSQRGDSVIVLPIVRLCQMENICMHCYEQHGL